MYVEKNLTARKRGPENQIEFRDELKKKGDLQLKDLSS
jgi:hypothetical protein